MSLTAEDLIIREEIRDALNAYSHGLDQRNWDIFARAWTPTGTFQAPAEGVPDPLPWQDFQQFLISRNDATRLSGQHLLNNTWFQIDGDTAHTVTEVTWLTLQQLDQPNMIYEIRAGGLYVDDLERTGDGWRIARRVLTVKSKDCTGILYPEDRIEAIRTTLTTNWYK
jgi:hypothetical protein